MSQRSANRAVSCRRRLFSNYPPRPFPLATALVAGQSVLMLHDIAHSLVIELVAVHHSMTRFSNSMIEVII